MHTITVTVGNTVRTVRDTDISLAREEAERVARIMGDHHPGETSIVESNDDPEVSKPAMSAEERRDDLRAFLGEITPPDPLVPSRRIMRAVGATHDVITVDGKRVVVDLQPWETSIDWVPTTIQLYSFPRRLDGGTRPIAAGSAVAIMREGFESAPLGVASDMYRPIDHHETVRDVAESTADRASFEGALIDGHGYHIVHAFRLAEPVPARIAEIAKKHKVEIGDGYPTSPTVRGLPLVSRLTLVHDHTGDGSLRASVVSYLGDDIVVGSACYTRRIHVGAGDKDVGVGDKARWLAVVDAMIDTAALQQGAIGALLAKAAETPMTDEAAKVFERHGVFVAREKVSRKERDAAAERGEPAPVGAIVAKTALDVVLAFYKQRSGRLTWGVWSRRLEGGALAALETICDMKLPKQLFRRG